MRNYNRMKMFWTAVLAISPLLQARADVAPQRLASPILKLDLGRDPPAGWVDDGQIQWKLVPRLIRESGCTRLPMPNASYMAIDSQGTIYFDGGDGRIWRLRSDGRLQSEPFGLSYPYPVGVVLAVGKDDAVWFGDPDRHYVARLNVDGTITQVAGQDRHSGHTDGTSVGASFGVITAIKADSDGNMVVVDDQLIRRVSPAGDVTTIAGSSPTTQGGSRSGRRGRDGKAREAVFAGIGGIAVSASGEIFVTDSGEGYNAVRKVDSSGLVTTLVDNLRAHSAFHELQHISADTDGSLLVVDNVHWPNGLPRPRILKVELSGRVTTRFDPMYPSGRYDSKNSGIFGLYDIAVDRQGRVYGLDSLATTIQLVDANGEVYEPCLEAARPQIN